jgi:DNA-binding HxlR family transcriptional regulator
MGKRTLKKIIKQKKKEDEKNNMINYLENKWKNKVLYSCEECLKTAYFSELEDMRGYVSDEELILSSKNKLRHK